jgi:hypothetical protein
MAVHAHRCRNARPPYAHDFMLYDIGDGEHTPFVAMMACRKCGEVRKAQEEALPPIALDDVLASVMPATPKPRARTKPARRKR